MDEDVKAKSVNGSVTVGVTSVVVLQANRHRTGAIICNDSDTAIYLTLGNPAVLNSGIRLNANGGVYEINNTNLYRGIITGSTSGAFKLITFVEIE